MIDDLLRDDMDDDDLDNFDLLDPSGLNLAKFNSYQAEDGTRISCVNEEELFKIREQAEQEKMQSMKQFQDLLKES